MIKKRNFKNRILLSIFVLMILSFYIAPVFASENNSVIIHLKDYTKEEYLSGRSFKIWKLTDKNLKKDFDNLQKDLEKLNEKELDKEYESFFTSPSDKEGRISLTNLDDGTYYARELLRKGEQSRIYSFLIFLPLNEDKSDIYPKTNIPQKPNKPHKLKLIKVSESGVRLENAIFELYVQAPDGVKKVPLKDNKYDPNGSLNVKLKTDPSGEISIDNLPSGTYIFREIKAPEGYKIINKDSKFEFKNNEQKTIYVKNLKDDKKGGYKFLKLDGKTGSPLSGAVFRVTQKQGDSYAIVKKDGDDYIVKSASDGSFYVDGLDYGKYYLWEIKAPDGYKPLSSYVEFEVNKDSIFNRIDIKNHKNKVEVLAKADSSGNGTSDSRTRTNGEIPKTGDITFLILLISGLILSFLGFSLIKKANN